ncbi:hypothetical protein NUV66_00480 [Pseudomonas sp. 32.2.56]|uniref:hypothetical protein n=1 Tax=Pseudomonas sp. 32.2.56 TaxID=2969303 RepID=UPI00214F867B|nr:hypothetical protein [Pseudomonas sp. 32.2.56]MCR4507762.1 hypothetical protein [Pseudomonas sp. 32.2.56]
MSKKKKAADEKFNVIEILPEEIALSKKTGKKNQAWIAADTWPGSAAVEAVQRGKENITITIVIEEKKPKKPK